MHDKIIVDINQLTSWHINKALTCPALIIYNKYGI